MNPVALKGGGTPLRPALRLGLRQIDGIKQTEVEKIIAARTALAPAPLVGEGWGGGQSPFRDAHDLRLRSGASLATLERLASADAFRSLGLDRRQALWEVKALSSAAPLPLFTWGQACEQGAEPAVSLPLMLLSEHVVNDYQTLRLSLKAHPMSFLRDRLQARRILSCAGL